MKTIGFVKTSMPDEERVAILPDDIQKNIENPEQLFFEEGYAAHLGHKDEEYIKEGARITSREEAYSKDVLCIPKPWINDIKHFKENQILMGWCYLAEKKDIARATINKNMTVIAWEDMYGPNRYYVFDKNRWYAGYITTTQALPFAKASPKNLKIAVLGDGRVAQGVFSRLKEEKATFDIFGNNLIESPKYVKEEFDCILKQFKERIEEYDVIINCWYYDPKLGHYLHFEDLQEMKDGALFIDVSSEGVDGSIPHPRLSPFYQMGRFKKIIVYNNNHAPSLWPLEVSQSISKDFSPYLNKVIKEELDPVITRATVLEKGKIIDPRINNLLFKDPTQH